MKKFRNCCIGLLPIRLSLLLTACVGDTTPDKETLGPADSLAAEPSDVTQDMTDIPESTAPESVPLGSMPP